MLKMKKIFRGMILAFGIWHLVIPAQAADPIEGLVEVLSGAEDVQLQFLGHSRQFSGAGRIEDDLEWSHSSGPRVKFWSI